jgi:hypothetical protein
MRILGLECCLLKFPLDFWRKTLESFWGEG